MVLSITAVAAFGYLKLLGGLGGWVGGVGGWVGGWGLACWGLRWLGRRSF